MHTRQQSAGRGAFALFASAVAAWAGVGCGGPPKCDADEVKGQLVQPSVLQSAIGMSPMFSQIDDLGTEGEVRRCRAVISVPAGSRIDTQYSVSRRNGEIVVTVP